jgi:membrane protein required for colicin V production
MTVYDIVLLLILAAFMYKGIKRGFISLIGSFIGIVVGAWIAGHYYETVAVWLIQIIDINIMLAIVIAFIGIYVVVNLVIGITAWIITTVFRIIPLATTLNRLIGAALGALEGLLLIGLIIWIVTLFPFQNSFISGLRTSKVASYFTGTTQLVQPLLPNGLRNVNIDVLSNLQTIGNDTGTTQYLQQNMPKIFEHMTTIKTNRDALMNQVNTELKKE